MAREEGLEVKVSAVCRLLKKYRETGTISRRAGQFAHIIFFVYHTMHHILDIKSKNYVHSIGSGRPSKITVDVLRIVEEQMRSDDETTAVQLQKILVEKGHALSLKTILASRDRLGWTFRGSAYCQIIRESNKAKRLQWAKDHIEEFDSSGFGDVLWTDESSIQMECHKRFSCRKKGEPAKSKPR